MCSKAGRESSPSVTPKGSKVISLRSKDAGGPSNGRAFPRGAVLSQSPASAVLERTKNSEETVNTSLLSVVLEVVLPTLMAAAAAVVLDVMAVV